MPLTTLTARTRAAWERLTEAGAAFAPVLCVAVSPESLLCPPGWTGIVVIDDAAVATAPDLRTAQVVQEALRTVPAALLTDASILSHRLPVAELLGPATLAYLDSGDFRPHQGPSAIEQLGPADSALHRFLSAADAAELEESGIEEITSPAFAVVERGHVAAAAGYRDWPSQVAHLSVLTAAPERGRGLPAWPRRPRSRMPCTGAGCRSGAHDPRRPARSPVPSASANTDHR